MAPVEISLQAGPRQGKSPGTSQRFQCKILSGKICRPSIKHHPPPRKNQLEEDVVGLKALEGYFNNLAAAAVNEKGFLQQLVLNNTTLSTSNESLVALVKKISGDIKNFEQEISRQKNGGQVSARNTTLCSTCKKEGFHKPQYCYELLKNKDKRPPGCRSAL